MIFYGNPAVVAISQRKLFIVDLMEATEKYKDRLEINATIVRAFD